MCIKSGMKHMCGGCDARNWELLSPPLISLAGHTIFKSPTGENRVKIMGHASWVSHADAAWTMEIWHEVPALGYDARNRKSTSHLISFHTMYHT